MSEILSNIVVEQNNINFTPNNNNINVTPEAIQLNIFTGSAPGAGQSSNGELLYNNQNLLDGVPNTSFANGNLSLGNVANLKIAGGVNGYFLQTDGTGNLDWAAGGGGNGAPGGSNTQIQYNDNGLFGGNTGFTFNEVSGNVNVPELIVAGNISTTNDVLAGNAGITGALFAATISGGNLNITANVLAQNINSNANVIGTNFTANGNIGVTGNVSANNATFSNLTLNSNVVHLGNNAGSNSGPFSIAVGVGAGNNNQGFGAIAIGAGAGAFGNGQYSIAIGADAGLGVQGNSAIAIGTGAGLIGQSDYVIAIGASAGYDGALNAQANNTIVLNATGANLVGNAFANAFYVKPVRSANTANVMYYNPTTGELTYNPLSTIAVGTANTVIDNAQPNITSLGTLTGVAVNGTVTAVNFQANTGIFTGNGSGLTSLTGANVTGTVANATFATSAGTAGTVTTNAQPNITSVGTLTSLSVTGNISAGNVSATTFTGALSGAATTAGTVTTNAQPNITSVGTLSSVAITGNATAGNVYANSGTIGASLLTGTVTTAAQPNITSIGSQTNLRLSGNVSMIQLNTGSAVSLGNTQFWDTSGTNLTGNFFIQLGALPNIGDVRQTSVLVTNGGANTFTWLQPGSPAALVSSAGNVNYFFNPTYPFTGTAKDLYKFTLARIANVGLNTAYDVIVEKTALT